MVILVARDGGGCGRLWRNSKLRCDFGQCYGPTDNISKLLNQTQDTTKNPCSFTVWRSYKKRGIFQQTTPEILLLASGIEQK